LQLCDNPDEVKNQTVTRVVKNPLTDHGKTLARRTTEDAVDFLRFEPSTLTNFGTTKIFDAGANDSGVRKVVLMYRAMHWVNFHCCCNIEACLFEPQR
jgi:hypothetical protein